MAIVDQSQPISLNEQALTVFSPDLFDTSLSINMVMYGIPTFAG